ncbi:hypothetical protein PRIPAC_91294 [Pristionchus pacificus]|uniref:NADH dehydrogenase [ubiquinone] iron-sulfur protein 4, mitochondrial n=1 Tax=Pristionchus pacificus TaxID=54126 RepID=A0A454Y376_PRIPA|nr:hypothetical protein PRIPAC_91294 [Pristionchus pacificus]|eukprot:PDM61299.1 hypothetical protein PRIPAC_50741 [Pristionchus pacificus]
MPRSIAGLFYFLQRAPRAAHTACRGQTRASSVPVVSGGDAKRKPIEEVMGTAQPKIETITTVEDTNKGVISGVPEEHQQGRTARIFKPAREATQQGWNNTRGWRIELDNRGRWENALIGWASSGDPLSNVSMHMKFGTKEDAISFCQKNNWNFEVEEPKERSIKPKSYGSIYSWNKRFRVSTK